MNSSDIKKAVWVINLAVVGVLGATGYFVYQQIMKPIVPPKDFSYTEPPPTEKIVQLNGLITKDEVRSVFNWKPPEPPKPVAVVKEEPKPVVKAEEPKSNITNMFSLETVMGRLAFITIKKDKKIRSFLAGDEIIDANDNLLGVLKEVREDSVLILLNGKIEVLSMELEVKKDEIASPVLSPANGNMGSVPPQARSNRGNHRLGRGNENTPKPIEAVIEDKSTNQVTKVNGNQVENVAPASNTTSKEPEPKVIATHTGNFNGTDFTFTDSIDSDGILHRKIPEEMATKIQSKESIRVLTSAKNYDLVFQSNGVLIKNIINPEARKFFTAFGITEKDVILSVNGQSLGNKTEDDLIQLYQQIVDSAKYATIELLKDGQVQKFRISTERLKNAGN